MKGINSEAIMRLNILISCYNGSVEGVGAMFQQKRGDVRYVVSHQMSEDYVQKNLPQAMDREDVIYAPFRGRGLSLNRNHCLDVVRAHSDHPGEEICLLADDDVSYLADSFDKVLEAFLEHPEISVAAFRIATPPGQPPFKVYQDKSFMVNKIPLRGKFYFSSIELAFRLSSIGDLRFDEDFGLGARKWPEGGEEAVFLCDCLGRGLKMMFFPEDVVVHDFMSSGKARKTIRKARMMQAVARRCYGPFSKDAIVGAFRTLYRVLTFPVHMS